MSTEDFAFRRLNEAARLHRWVLCCHRLAPGGERTAEVGARDWLSQRGISAAVHPFVIAFHEGLKETGFAA